MVRFTILEAKELFNGTLFQINNTLNKGQERTKPDDSDTDI